jgi:hypothetical protein
MSAPGQFIHQRSPTSRQNHDFLKTLVSANWERIEQREMGQNMVSWICEKQAVHEVTHFCD